MPATQIRGPGLSLGGPRGPRGLQGKKPWTEIDYELDRVRFENEDGSPTGWIDIGSARRRAEEAATVASGLASAFIIAENTFATKATAEAWHPEAAPDYIRTAGRSAPGDGGDGLYRKGDNLGRSVINPMAYTALDAPVTVVDGIATKDTTSGGGRVRYVGTAGTVAGTRYEIRIPVLTSNGGEIRCRLTGGVDTPFHGTVAGQTLVFNVTVVSGGSLDIEMRANFQGSIDLNGVTVRPVRTSDLALLTITQADGQAVRYHDPLLDDIYVSCPHEYPTWQSALDALSQKKLRQGRRVFLMWDEAYELTAPVTVAYGDYAQFFLQAERGGTIHVGPDAFIGSIVAGTMASMPTLACLIDAHRNNGNLGEDNGAGYQADTGSRGHVLPGCGILNAGSSGLLARNSSIKASGTFWSGAGIIGVVATRAAMIRCERVTADDCRIRGIYVSRQSIVDASDGSSFKNAGEYGARVLRSRLMANDADFSGAGIDAISAGHTAQVFANTALIEGAGLDGLSSYLGSIIVATQSTVTDVTRWAANCQNGSKIVATGSTLISQGNVDMNIRQGSFIMATGVTTRDSETPGVPNPANANRPFNTLTGLGAILVE